MKRIACLAMFALSIMNGAGAKEKVDDRSALEVVKSVGNKLIRNTPFKYRLTVAPNWKTFNGLKSVDFGRTFGLGNPGVAYALTNITSDTDCLFPVQVEHSDGCKVWLNEQLIYEQEGTGIAVLQHEERSIELSHKMKLHLREGNNILLVKSETAGADWRFYIQPESDKGAVILEKRPEVKMDLSSLELVDRRVAELTNWLICGTFINPIENGTREGLSTAYMPESDRTWGKMYDRGDATLTTWSIPRIDILGDVVDPVEWGTNYNWNYHNGGVAWAMQELAKVSGDKKYDDYASAFCNFHLDGLPFIAYQINSLNAFGCANNQIYETPLLDFTLAPSIPFVYRLIRDKDFDRREEYKAFVDRMIEYGRNEQIRLPGSAIYTRTTPEKYTTWVDDMYMGIPFLIQASLYTGDQSLLQDAAGQVFGFNEQVWDKETQLYMHAKYSEKDTKLPHWTRANGWALWAISEVLLHLPKSDPKYKPILKHHQEHIKSLVRYQNENGFWYNVVEYPQSKEEVSGTAIIVMTTARAIRMGWLDRKTYLPVVEKGWNALKTQISEDGTVRNICYGTMCTEDIDYYFNRPFYTDDTHGLFAVLQAGIEVYKLFK